jgi:hypothetical protein
MLRYAQHDTENTTDAKQTPFTVTLSEAKGLRRISEQERFFAAPRMTARESADRDE